MMRDIPYFISATIFAGIIVFVLVVSAVGHDHAIMAQWSPEQQRWLREQSSPLAANCCNEADGDFSEEEIRYENGLANYWTRSAKSDGVWHIVPTEALIRGANKIGVPVVWWAQTYDEQGGKISLSVRCFAPGAGL